MEHRDIWETYVQSWKVETAEEKLALFDQCLAEKSVYTDPLTQARTKNDLVQYMLDFHQQIDGGHFVTTYFLSHHNKSVAKWNMCNRQGEILGEGISFGEYNEQGKLIAETGFFEVPEQGN
ncbi:hypothetical protein [Vibrio nigripulchritudo]|uniref:hypothetical protein n=1 Tax=Vibrio nigripulchritudo TaxID=28173 RepID=UPI0003B18DA7|nr:hypothetical protein [Vibrio nigripulchritudo]CCN72160.1 conserved hypothetical protein [Vibrio nigripulchritudo SFn118]